MACNNSISKPMQKLDQTDNNSEKLKQKNLPEEEKKFIKESKNAKVIPINEDLECTYSQISIASSISKKFSNIKNKLLSFSSERMTTEFNSRYNFIRNVFLLLCFQSVFSCVFIVLALQNEKFGEGIIKSKVLLIISSTTLGLLGLLILLYRKLFKIRILKWFFFCLFLITKTYVVAYVSRVNFTYDLIALHFMFFGVSLCLVIYSIISRKKFINSVALLTTFLSCTAFFGISFAFAQANNVKMFCMYIGVLLFSFFIVYDIQLIAGGRFQDFTYDDYVPTSLMIFVEIIGILYYIVKLFTDPV